MEVWLLNSSDQFTYLKAASKCLLKNRNIHSSNNSTLQNYKIFYDWLLIILLSGTEGIIEAIKTKQTRK